MLITPSGDKLELEKACKIVEPVVWSLAARAVETLDSCSDNTKINRSCVRDERDETNTGADSFRDSSCIFFFFFVL